MLFYNFENSQVTAFLCFTEFDVSITYCSDYFLIKSPRFFYSDLGLGTEIEDNS